MTEQEAIESLTSEITGEAEQPQEAEQSQEAEQPPQEEAKPTFDVTSIIEKQAQTEAQLKELKDELKGKQEETPPVPPTEEEQMIAQAQEKLGIAEIKQQLIEQQQQAELQQQFQKDVNEFQKEVPNVSLDDVQKFAMDNGYEQFMGNKQGWKLISQVMLSASQPQAKPDPITPTVNGGSNTQPKPQERPKNDLISMGEDILGIL